MSAPAVTQKAILKATQKAILKDMDREIAEAVRKAFRRLDRLPGA